MQLKSVQQLRQVERPVLAKSNLLTLLHTLNTTMRAQLSLKYSTHLKTQPVLVYLQGSPDNAASILSDDQNFQHNFLHNIPGTCRRPKNSLPGLGRAVVYNKNTFNFTKPEQVRSATTMVCGKNSSPSNPRPVKIPKAGKPAQLLPHTILKSD